jgi:hypothetical protein
VSLVYCFCCPARAAGRDWYIREKWDAPSTAIAEFDGDVRCLGFHRRRTETRGIDSRRRCHRSTLWPLCVGSLSSDTAARSCLVTLRKPAICLLTFNACLLGFVLVLVHGRHVVVCSYEVGCSAYDCIVMNERRSRPSPSRNLVYGKRVLSSVRPNHSQHLCPSPLFDTTTSPSQPVDSGLCNAHQLTSYHRRKVKTNIM